MARFDVVPGDTSPVHGLLAKGAIARFYLRQHIPDTDALPIATISRSALETLQTNEPQAT